MTKEEAFAEINQIQDFYVDKLMELMSDPGYDSMKTISFTSPTGTGKTKMMSKLINRLPDCYFIVTTLSKGQLHLQIRNSLKEDCNNDNFTVYGSADYKINSRLEAEDIICGIPDDTKCIWLRDEGHIRTNRFEELLSGVCYKVVNFSATNSHSDIQCNFATTMMLRTVNQTNGTPEDAIKKLVEIKALHKGIKDYNPCAIFRCVSVDDGLYNSIVNLCKRYCLEYIDLTDDPFVMAELCKDNNEYDVIINKFKLNEGIDIRRAHVLYMDNQPGNNATTIQVIGRCRRNALLYRDDIDILAPENTELLKVTRECYVYYNVESMKVNTDEAGKLQYAFCNHVSCEALKTGSIVHVENGQLPNGLYVLELEGETGKYKIDRDEGTGFNVVEPLTEFYDTIETHCDDSYIYCFGKKIHVDKVTSLPIKKVKKERDEVSGIIYDCDVEPYYPLDCLWRTDEQFDLECSVSEESIAAFEEHMKKYTKRRIESVVRDKCLDKLIKNADDSKYNIKKIKHEISDYVESNSDKKGMKQFCRMIRDIEDYPVYNLRIADICSNNEICLLTQHLIKLKRESCTNEEIERYVKNYFTMRYHFVNITHGIDDITGFKNGFERIAHVIFMNNIRTLYCNYNKIYLTLRTSCLELDELCIEKERVEEYFDRIDRMIGSGFDDANLFVSSSYVADRFISDLHISFNKLKKGLAEKVKVSYAPLFEDMNEDEKYLASHFNLNKSIISVREVNSLKKYNTHDKIINDRESAIIGVDLMHQVKYDNGVVNWVEQKTVTSKIESYNKLNSYISDRYDEELEQAKDQCFTGKNSFNLNKKCNSVLGYCVEYYSKYLIYGESYLGDFIGQALSESETDDIDECVIIRACMLKYKEMMVRCFGAKVSKYIRGISVSSLVQDDHKLFTSLVVELGKKTAGYVREVLYHGEENPKDDVDPNLSIQHIAGLADYITNDTILDVKVRNNIDEKCVRQVLAYHYLSTKRSDLEIKRLIVYDAVSNRSVVIDIGKKCKSRRKPQKISPIIKNSEGVEELYKRIKEIKERRALWAGNEQITIESPETRRFMDKGHKRNTQNTCRTHRFDMITRHISELKKMNKADYGKWTLNAETDGNEDDQIRLSYVKYSDSVQSLMNDVEAFCDAYSEFKDDKYLDILKKNSIRLDVKSISNVNVNKAGSKCIVALLLRAFRSEEQCDGVLLSLLRDGSILRWLERLKEIDIIGVGDM